MAGPSYEYHGMMVSYWDLLRGDTSGWPDRSFYLDRIARSGQPVLDVGCASGRLLLDYLAQGIDIDGVDLSPEMIALCRRQAERRGLRPRLYVQDMATLDLPRRYRTILVPSSSLQLLLAPDQPLQAMRRFHDHLLPGGSLVAPFMTLWQEGAPLEGEFTQEATRPEDGAIVRRRGWWRYDPATRMESTRDSWELIAEGRVIASETHEQAPATRSYTQAEALMLFEQAGFRDLQVFSGFSLDAAKPEDRLFSVAGRRPA